MTLILLASKDCVLCETAKEDFADDIKLGKIKVVYKDEDEGQYYVEKYRDKITDEEGRIATPVMIDDSKGIVMGINWNEKLGRMVAEQVEDEDEDESGVEDNLEFTCKELIPTLKAQFDMSGYIVYTDNPDKYIKLSEQTDRFIITISDDEVKKDEHCKKLIEELKLKRFNNGIKFDKFFRNTKFIENVEQDVKK